jgi:hypothetical protein
MRKGIKAAALVAGLLGASAANAEVEAVSAARLLDVASGKYVDNPLVIVTDGRITSIGKKGDAVPAGANVVDLPGATLLPGPDRHARPSGQPGRDRRLYGPAI